MHVKKIKNTMAMIKKRIKKIKSVKITFEEAEAIARKTGYSNSGIQRIVRKKSRDLRHRQVMELYNRILYLRSLHEENYRKDLQTL